jgi:hypothetical protein
VVTLFGTTYYTIGTGLVVLTLLAPLLWGFSRWALRPNVEGKPWRARLMAEGGLTTGLLLLAAVGLYWDVYLIGQRAKVLCEQTGLVVYRTAVADGFLGSSAIEAWSRHGFKFVEMDYLGKLSRYELIDGRATKTAVSDRKSRYALTSAPRIAPERFDGVDARVTIRASSISEISSGQLLAEMSSVTVDRGWIDRAWIRFTGFSALPYICGRTRNGNITISSDRLNIEDLVLSALRPN